MKEVGSVGWDKAHRSKTMLQSWFALGQAARVERCTVWVSDCTCYTVAKVSETKASVVLVR